MKTETPRTHAWLAVAAAATVALAATGCQTMKKKPDVPGANATQAPGGPEPSGPKTEFHSSVGPEQEYNVHVDMARVFETQGSHEQAAVEYQKAVDVCTKKGGVLAHAKLGPAQHALAERRMAAAFDRLGRFTQAEAHYLKALKLAPNDAKVWNDAGYSYYMQHRLADAERCLKTADKFEPGNPRVLTNLGLTLAAQGRNDEALAALSRAGGPATGHANLGFLLAALGKTEQARKEYRSALEAQPEMAAARQALAKLDATPAKADSPLIAMASAGPVKPVPPPAIITGVAGVPARPANTRDAQLARTSTAKPKPRPGKAADRLPTLPLPTPNPGAPTVNTPALSGK